VLVDLTEWASADTGIMGGFVCPVAVTAAVWTEIHAIPPRAQGLQDVRGRARDVLWMAAMATRDGGREAKFTVLMDLGRSKWQEYKMVMSPEAPGGAACITIMRPGED
jgi:hypothetical protein